MFDSAGKKAKLLNRDAAIGLFTKNPDIDLEVIKAQWAFASSKMTVVTEGN